MRSRQARWWRAIPPEDAGRHRGRAPPALAKLESALLPYLARLSGTHYDRGVSGDAPVVGGVERGGAATAINGRFARPLNLPELVLGRREQRLGRRVQLQ